MLGIISRLTGEAYLEVRRLQRWLEEEHESSKPESFHPHVTYAIEDGRGDRDRVIERIESLAGSIDPVTMVTAGLGVFPGPSPVLYLPVPRGPELTSIHHAVCQILTDSGGIVHLYYRPENWLPHVTLASEGVTAEMVAAVVDGFPLQPLTPTCQLTGFALVENVGEERVAITREFPFRGENELAPNPYGLVSRPCQPFDRDFVYDLVKETLGPFVSAFYQWDERRFEQNWVQSWRKKIVVLAEGRPVGYIQYDKSPADTLYISNLFLMPTIQEQGWGGWLLGQMENAARGRPIRLHIWENNPAVSFYQHHGYQIIETQGHKHLMEKG